MKLVTTAIPATLALLLVYCNFAWGTAASAPSTRDDAVQPRPILTPAQQLAVDRELIDRFIRHALTSESVPESARKTVADAWSKHRTDEQPRDFLTAALAIVCEPFKRGIEALDKEDLPAAANALRPLLNHTDPWISLNASAALTRALVEQDQLDEAEQLLTSLTHRRAELLDKTFLETEIDFLLAYCQLANLQYDKAQNTLEQFEQLHPSAPDKYRLPARQMLAELNARRPRGLGEVSDLMIYAGRRLNRGLADQPVHQSQQRAVELLNTLIKEAENREEQQRKASAGGKGKGSGGQRMGDSPSSPARQSMLPPGPGSKGELESRPAARPGEMWGRMKPEDRQRILQSLREGFPNRYRQLVEQYYRQLAKEQ